MTCWTFRPTPDTVLGSPSLMPSLLSQLCPNSGLSGMKVLRGRNGKAVLCFKIFFGPGKVLAMARSGEEGNLSFYGLL